MPFLGKTPAQGFVNSVTKDDFTPNGTTTAFTLSKSPATVNEIEVYVGNVRQEPTDAYSVSGTTLTMTEAPATGTNFYVMHIGGTTQSSTTLPGGSVVPGALSVSGDLAVDTSAFFVDASTNKVGIGTASPSQELDISSTNPAVRLTDTTTSGLYHDLVSFGNDLRFSADGGDVQADTNIEFYVDNAEKMRITSDGHVGIGTTPATTFHAKRDNDNQLTATIENNGSATTGRHVLKLISSGTGSGTKLLELQSAGGSTTRLEVLADGRGLSQFTAKAWMRYDQDHNIVRDSHNVSSVTDHSLGVFTMNFSNNMGNNHYCVQATGHYGGSTNDMGIIQWADQSDLTTSSAKFYFISQINNGTSGTLYDVEEAMILIFGD